MNAKKALAKIKQGDAAAFDAFYDETHRAVYFAAYAVLKDCALAEDVMQDTFVSFFNKLGEIDEGKNPLAYLTTAAKNKAINIVTRRRREVPVDFDPETDGRNLTYTPDYDTTLLVIAKRELTDEEFRVVHKIAIEGYSKTDVAKLLGKPITTVVWKYNKALHKIKDCYEKEVRFEQK